jgi:zinc transporter ZupT
MNWFTLIAALFLALTHLFAGHLRFSYLPRSKWLSFAGGISVAYVFIHIMPELAESQHVLENKTLNFLEHHTYLIALFGLALFYGLEKAAKQTSNSERTDNSDEMKSNQNVFWLHIASFAVYNALIGYLIVHREDYSGLSLLWFTLAMAFHFVVNDYALMDHYPKVYKKKGRWIITISILGGWLAGTLTEVSEVWVIVPFAFVAGGVILNVLKEELPKERESNFWAFLLGLVIYGGLLMVM